MNLRSRFALAAVATALYACETVPSSDLTLRPVTATVSNSSGKSITAITYQPCGDDSGSWMPISVGPIASGSSSTFDLPADCVNMQAFYADGKLAGSQTGVRRDFPFSWVIR